MSAIPRTENNTAIHIIEELVKEIQAGVKVFRDIPEENRTEFIQKQIDRANDRCITLGTAISRLRGDTVAPLKAGAFMRKSNGKFTQIRNGSIEDKKAEYASACSEFSCESGDLARCDKCGKLYPHAELIKGYLYDLCDVCDGD